MLRAYWRDCLDRLRDAGSKALRNHRTYELAITCKPYAFAYAGEGESCRLWFCPFCHAAEAAAAYERAWRVVGRLGPDVGFVVGQDLARVDLDDLPPDPSELLGAAFRLRAGSRGAAAPARSRGVLIRLSAFPHEYRPGVVVVTGRTLVAVDAARAKATYEPKRQVQEAVRAARAAGRYGVITFAELGLVWEDIARLYSGRYAVRPSAYSLARAVAHVCQYPVDLLDAPPAAAVIDRLAGVRLSTTRGVFRDPIPVHPSRYSPRCVPTRPQGAGVADALLAQLPSPTEAMAARVFARELGLPPAASFAQAARSLGQPVYWLGLVEGGLIRQFAAWRGKTQTWLWRAATVCRVRASEQHLLVCLNPGAGLIVFSTRRPDLMISRDGQRVVECLPGGAWFAVGVAVRGVRYTAVSLEGFRR